jgi:DNA-binding MarR family transcriptional regulator
MTTVTATPTASVEQLVRAIYGLGLVHREIARHALAELGSQGFTALAIVHRDAPVRVSDIAQRLRVDLSVASRQVAALAAAGYVEREADPGDRRAHRITITPSGERVLRESHRRMVDAFAHALESWPEQEVERLARDLDRLREDFARTVNAAPQESTTR